MMDLLIGAIRGQWISVGIVLAVFDISASIFQETWFAEIQSKKDINKITDERKDPKQAQFEPAEIPNQTSNQSTAWLM